MVAARTGDADEGLGDVEAGWGEVGGGDDEVSVGWGRGAEQE